MRNITKVSFSKVGLWISWHPPFAHSAQRLGEKWTTCENLLESTCRGPQEAIHVFRMSRETARWAKPTVAGRSGRARAPAVIRLTCRLSNNQLRLSQWRAPPRRHRRLPPAGGLRLSAESSWFWSKGGRKHGGGRRRAERHFGRWRGTSWCVTRSSRVKAARLRSLPPFFDLCTASSERQKSPAPLTLLRRWGVYSDITIHCYPEGVELRCDTNSCNNCCFKVY